MKKTNKRIIDTCCLLDLYAGWGGLDPLDQLKCDWYICPATLKEARYIRSYDAARNIVKVPVDLKSPLQQELIQRVDATDEEFVSFLQFARELGDGEAMSLAIAKRRGWVLATDDDKATKTAKNAGVITISTPEIIKTWAQLNDDNVGSLGRVLHDIEKRACYRPSPRSPLFDWWN